MKPDPPTQRGATNGRSDRGEGARNAEHRYQEVRQEFRDVLGGKADSAAREARRGPHPTRVSLDELVNMGRTVVDRVRPYVERAIGKLRARFHRK